MKKTATAWRQAGFKRPVEQANDPYLLKSLRIEVLFFKTTEMQCRPTLRHTAGLASQESTLGKRPAPRPCCSRRRVSKFPGRGGRRIFFYVRLGAVKRNTTICSSEYSCNCHAMTLAWPLASAFGSELPRPQLARNMLNVDSTDIMRSNHGRQNIDNVLTPSTAWPSFLVCRYCPCTSSDTHNSRFRPRTSAAACAD